MIFLNVVWKCVKRQLLIKRTLCSNAGPTLFVELLKSRTLLNVNGENVEEYLQGLISNDVKHLQEGSPCMYTMFLNSKGRILYDSIVYNTDDSKTFFVECDLSAVESLRKHLLMYKVRRKINIDSLAEKLNVWCLGSSSVLLNSEDKNIMKTTVDLVKESLKGCLICSDPRVASLGLRIIAPKQLNIISALKSIQNLEVVNNDFYKNLRYRLGIAEGVNELPPGNCFPLEANCDYLHGVSFHKGCYIGQELTARTYHTGTVRKRIMPLVFDGNIGLHEGDMPIVAENVPNKPIGKLRGAQGTVGIGLLRINEAMTATKLLIIGKELTTHLPFWWPAELQKKKVTLNQFPPSDTL